MRSGGPTSPSMAAGWQPSSPAAPEPSSATTAPPSSGASYEVDFFWPDLGLVVETDGLRYHRTPAQQARDRLRDQAHTAAGLTGLRFTHAQVRFSPDHVAKTLAAVASRLRPEEGRATALPGPLRPKGASRPVARLTRRRPGFKGSDRDRRSGRSRGPGV